MSLFLNYDQMEPEDFMHAKISEIIIHIRHAKFKFTAAGRIRSEVKNLPDEYSSEILSTLRRQIVQPGYQDITRYIEQIVN